MHPSHATPVEILRPSPCCRVPIPTPPFLHQTLQGDEKGTWSQNESLTNKGPCEFEFCTRNGRKNTLKQSNKQGRFLGGLERLFKTAFPFKKASFVILNAF